jgi:hypothetical protein
MQKALLVKIRRLVPDLFPRLTAEKGCSCPGGNVISDHEDNVELLTVLLVGASFAAPESADHMRSNARVGW